MRGGRTGLVIITAITGWLYDSWQMQLAKKRGGGNYVSNKTSSDLQTPTVAMGGMRRAGGASFGTELLTDPSLSKAFQSLGKSKLERH